MRMLVHRVTTNNYLRKESWNSIAQTASAEVERSSIRERGVPAAKTLKFGERIARA